MIALAHMMVRVDAALTDELAHAFPTLIATVQPPTTTLIGEVQDQEELQGILNLLRTLGISVIEVVTIPE